MSFSRHFTKCEHEKYRHFAAISRVFVVFYNVNTVRSEMWVWDFPNHSSSTRDLENTILTFPPHSILSLLWLNAIQDKRCILESWCSWLIFFHCFNYYMDSLWKACLNPKDYSKHWNCLKMNYILPYIRNTIFNLCSVYRPNVKTKSFDFTCS